MANIIDPFEVFKTTKSFVVPTTSPHAPFPTVTPNPPKFDFEFVGKDGERTLWVVFVVMVIASISFIGMAWRVPVSKRLYHIITTMITVIAALSYFAMATRKGFTVRIIPVHDDHKHTPPTFILRQVYWARYVDWTLTTPLVLLDLSLLAGLSGANILIVVLAAVVMCLTGLFAVFADTVISPAGFLASKGIPDRDSKWGWFAIACIAYLVIVWQFVVNGRASARTKGAKVSSFFTFITGYTLVVWAVYLVVWGIAIGSCILSVDGEIIVYAVLDLLAKPIFGAWLLFTHLRMPEMNIDLGGFWSHGISSEGRIRVGEDDEGA